MANTPLLSSPCSQASLRSAPHSSISGTVLRYSALSSPLSWSSQSLSYKHFSLRVAVETAGRWKWESTSHVQNLTPRNRRFSPRAAVDTSVETTELNAISKYSEIVPDTVIFDDFERLKPTAATVSSSLLLGITGLPESKLNSSIERALANEECYLKQQKSDRLSCFLDMALVNVGAELVKLVPGRVSTEVDARLAYDTDGIINKVHDLVRLYKVVGISRDRLLFKIPATWQGIGAIRQLEEEGIRTHVTFIYSFPQAAAAAQAGASVIQIFVGRLRDWAHQNSGDEEINAAISKGEDPGISLVTKAYNYIHKHGLNTKLMAAAIRNKQDIFSLLGVDYVIVPVKILQSLQDSKALMEDKYSFVQHLTPNLAKSYAFSGEELVRWEQTTFAAAFGMAPAELLARGLEGCINNTKRLEEYFAKVWPPPNV